MKTKGMMILAAVMLWLSPAKAQERQNMAPEQRAAKITEWMKANLKLNDEQVSKVSEINQRYAMKTGDLKKDMKDMSKTEKKEKMSSLKALDKEKDSELKAVLSEAQFTDYLAKKEEMKKQVKQKMQEKKKGSKS